MSETTTFLVGQPVWARIGGYGWSKAIIAEITGEKAKLHFVIHPALRSHPAVEYLAKGRLGKLKVGRRFLSDLRPRNPLERGKDKPPVMLLEDRAAGGAA